MACLGAKGEEERRMGPKIERGKGGNIVKAAGRSYAVVVVCLWDLEKACSKWLQTVHMVNGHLIHFDNVNIFCQKYKLHFF